MDEKGTKKEITISWVQSSYQGSEPKTVQHYLRLAHSLSHTDILVFPELMFSEYFPLTENDAYFSYAKSTDDSSFDQFKNLAQDKNAVVVLPFYEKDFGKYFNSVLVFDTDGTVAGKYRKMHIPYDPGFYEKNYFQEGDTGFVPIKTSVATIGVLICWDQWFPEAARMMALKGADILIYPTAIGWDDTEPESVNDEQLDAWKTSMRAHSIANGIFTVAVNRIGKEGNIDFWGNSFICRPNGQLINTPHHSEELYSTTINLGEAQEYLDIWPFFRDRRTDSYSALLDKGVEKKQSGMKCERRW